MKSLILAAVVSLVALTAPAHADVNKSVTHYQAVAYESSTGTDKFGIIRLYAAGSIDPFAYLHFHRSSDSMPKDRTYEMGTAVHAHYDAADWERFLSVLDRGDPISFVYETYYENVYLTRTTTLN